MIMTLDNIAGIQNNLESFGTLPSVVRANALPSDDINVGNEHYFNNQIIKLCHEIENKKKKLNLPSFP